MVNSKYFPKSGIASDVGGIISANSKKNTVNERRMEEHNDTCKNSIFYTNLRNKYIISFYNTYFFSRITW